MKKKYLLIISIILLIVGFTNLFSTLRIGINLSKLKGDVTGASNDPYIFVSCSKETLDVNETSNCSLKINSLSKDIGSFNGKLSVNDKLELSNVTVNSAWNNLASVDNEYNLIVKSGDSLNGEAIDVIDFQVKALGLGSGKINFTDNETDPLSIVVVGEGDIFLSDYSKEIVISSGDQELSNDATLREIKVDGTSISLTNLNHTVSANTTSVNIVPITNDTNATFTIQYNGTYEIENGSINVTLKSGTSTIKIIVTAEDNSKRTYTLNITKEQSQEYAYLNSLTVSAGTLSPEFSPTVNDYSVTVGNSISSITINATSDNNNAVITGDGNKALVVGENNVQIKVSLNNKDTYYDIVITRRSSSSEMSSDTSIKEIKVNDTVVNLNKMSLTLDYEGNDYATIKVTANNDNATVSGKIGRQSLTIGVNKLNITVTAEDGTVKAYVLEITRKAKSGNISCTLSSDVYSIDNEKGIIGGVDINDDSAKIKKNLTASCGVITVVGDKATITYNDIVKNYAIQRGWSPNTGNDIIKYSTILASLIIFFAIALILKLTIFKKE